MQKWEVVRVYCDFLANPHDKFCICICPNRNVYFFINSEPPQFRKARDLAISIENYEANFLSHQSFVDTTTLQEIPSELVVAAYAEPERRHGLIAPFLRTRIKDAVEAHEVLRTELKDLVLNE